MEPKAKRNLVFWLLLLIFVGGVGVAIVLIKAPSSTPEAKSLDSTGLVTEAASRDAEISETKSAGVFAEGNAVTSSNNTSAQRVFRLVLDGKECSLEAVEEVRGDFRRRRADPEAHPGMILSRLVGANGEILAEEFTHAPDHACTVLDPNLDGTPRSVTLTEAGPHTFQVRFSQDLGGEELQIHRVTQTEPALRTDLLLATAVKP